MTIRFGVEQRLRWARLGWQVDAAAPELERRVAEGFAAGVDLVVVAQGALPDDALAEVLPRLRDAAPARGLVAVRGSAELARTALADVRLLEPGEAVRPARRSLHRWGLVGVATSTRPALTQQDADFLWLGAPADAGLVSAAVQAAPATRERSRPWFAVVDATADPAVGSSADALLASGACRLAVIDEMGELAELAERLRSIWESDPALRRLQFAAAG